MNLLINLDKFSPYLAYIGGAVALLNGNTMEGIGLFIIGSLWRIENLLEYGPFDYEIEEENEQ